MLNFKVKTCWIGGKHPCEGMDVKPKPQVKKHLQKKPKDEWKKPGPKDEPVKYQKKSKEDLQTRGVKPKVPYSSIPVQPPGSIISVVDRCKALAYYHGNAGAAAKALGIGDTTFRKILDGHSKYPSIEILEKLGLKPLDVYEVI